MNTMTRRAIQLFGLMRLIGRNFGGARRLGLGIAVLIFAVATGLSPAWAQGSLGVPLPTPLGSTVSGGGIAPNNFNTWVTPFVATQNGIITTWKAQFSNSGTSGSPPSCGIPTSIQLKILRLTAANTLTVISAGSVFNPLALLQARSNTTACPSFTTASSASVLQFTESGLAVLAGDIIGFTVMNDPIVSGYFLPFATVSGNTRIRVENTPVGGTINLTDPFTGTLTGLAPALQVNGTAIYVSTFSGNQILQIFDSSPARIAVVNTDSTKSPEGIVVGPDGKVYVCDATNSVIRRISIDPGSLVVETVYNFFLTTGSQCNGPCPTGPEGPSFNTRGDLYFNTRSSNHTGVWKIPQSQLNSLPTMGTTTPVNVVPAFCASGSSFCDNSTWGEGTVFDLTDRLLFVDRSGGNVWRLDPSTSPASLQQLISVPGTTFLGIAVGPNSGDIFVASRGSATVPGSIQRFGSSGASMGAYVTAGITGGFDSGDRPEFIKFDASGRLFVGTEQITFDSTSGAVTSETTGKLWRVDPPVAPSTTGTATLVAALPAPPCSPTLTTSCPPAPPAVGIGVGPTNFSITQPFNLSGGSLTFARPTYNYIYQGYPATTCTTTNPVNVRFTFLETTDAQWTQRVQGTLFAGTSLIHYAGTTGGYGLVGRVEFFDATTGSAVSCTASGPYNVITNFKTANPNAITSQGPGFLKASVGGSNFKNIFVFYDPTTDPTDGGTTDDGWSDFAPVVGVTGTAPTVTITTPTATTYTLTQTVLANYSCSPPAGTPPVLQCLGTVPNGSPINTSSVGTKTFQVNTVVSAGPTAAQKVTYNVAGFNICLLYDPTRAAKSGSTIPIKLQLCDGSGNDLSSSSIIVHATSVVQTSTFASSTVIDAGNANPDSDFRFDSTLGPTGGYIFNLQTTGLLTGSYVLNFTAGPDPTPHTAPFQVR